MKTKRQSGFSLIELLIVVTIILVIAAIAIPNLMASRMAANESAAAQETRAIITANIGYMTQYNIGFASQLSYLGDGGTVSSTNAGFIDAVLANGIKSGYNFTYAPTSADSLGNFQGFTLNVDPSSPGYSGRKHFYTDQSAVIRLNTTTAASSSDPAI